MICVVGRIILFFFQYSQQGVVNTNAASVIIGKRQVIKYAKELFLALIPLEIKWFGQASFKIDDELIDLTSKSGCDMLFFGLESLNQNNLLFFNKKHNNVELYEKLITKMHNANIAVGASFMLGLPYDEANCLNELIEFSIRNRLEVVFVNIFTPYHGTDFFENQDWQDKDLCKDYHSTASILPIYTPKGLSKKNFRKMFLDSMRRLYSDELFEKRIKNCEKPGPFFINQANQDLYNSPIMDMWVNECK